jgi:phosphoenolpyruvate carboxykinase (ATP)
MSIKDTRACIDGILNGSINDAEFDKLPIFNLAIPKELDGVKDNTILNPRETWEDKTEYDEVLTKLAGMFQENFHRYDGDRGEFDYASAGPQT